MRRYHGLILLSLFPCALSAQNFLNGQAARAVIGQFGFTYGSPSPAQQIIGGASGVAYANGMLWVADSNRVGATPIDNRVLMFLPSQIPDPRADLTSLVPFDPANCNLCAYPALNVLGEPDYVTTTLQARSSQSLQTPTAVATDGRILAVADTDNNRVLIWTSIPTNVDQPANIVLGQTNFTNGGTSSPPNQSSLRGPQGVWIQNGKLFVADTQDYRVLIWNSIPTSNNQPADLVLGQPNFNSANSPPISPGTNPTTAANELLNPVAVTSDGTHLFVADLGFNRVLIWNSIPTAMDQNADVVVGQPLMVTAVPNWSSALCPSNGTDSNGNPTYPSVCGATLNFPRFALSDGTRLFIADGGNDRVLIFNSIPTQNGATADEVLGQPDMYSDVITSQGSSIASTAIDNTGSVDTIPTPTSLAFDGTNLYVADPYNRRILVFTPGDTVLPVSSVVNWASEITRQEALVSLSGTIVANDTVTISIQGTNYTYTVKSSDTLDSIAKALVGLINANAGDPNATALFAGPNTATVYLSSKGINLPFDSISISASSSNTADITATASSAYLSAGAGATGSPGMLVEIDGTNLSDVPSGSPVMAQLSGTLPTTLGGAQVYMDGIATPILSASATQIVTQIPYAFTDRDSTSVYVRTLHNNGSVTITNATPVYLGAANPGLFNAPSYPNQPRPWPAVGALHQSGNPTAVVAVGGTINAGDMGTITINGANYTYTVQAADSLASVVQALIGLINNAPDPNVVASTGGAYDTIILTARQSGQAGTGIPIAASVSTNADLTVTAYTSSTCCAVVPGSLITPSNPAAPGELITVLAAGLGPLVDAGGNALSTPATGVPFNGVQPNSAANGVSATMGGSVAQVVSSGLPQGSYGMYQVQLIVPAGLPSNSTTPLYIAQNAFISNIVTIPVGTAVSSAGPAAVSQILLNPVSLVFANQNLGSATTTQTVTVSNSGGAAVNITSIALAGANAGSFSESDNCSNTTLVPGANCTISVTYTTGSSGMNTASLLISDNLANSPQTVQLIGAQISAFEIVNVGSGKVLDVSNLSTANGAVIQQWDYLGGANQKWQPVAVGNGYFSIMNVLSGKVLDVTNLSLSDGAVIQQWAYTGAGNQKWQFLPTGNGSYEIVNQLSGKVLDVTDFSTADGAVIQQWDYLGGANQQWQLTPLQSYKIVNQLSGKVLDVTNFSVSDGALVQQWDYLGGGNQQWQLVAVDPVYYKIVSVASGRVLDVVDQSTSDGAQIQIWDYLGGDNQKWAIVPTANGYYAIVNKGSGKALDDSNFSLIDGNLLQQWDYLGGANQQWQLVPVGNPGQ